MNKKQSKILDATIKLFLENSVKKTTMDEIAEKANVSKVTIYKYFGDKDSLYFEVGKSIFDDYSSKLTELIKQDIEVDEKLNIIMDILTEFISNNKLTLCKELTKLNDELDDVNTDFEEKYKANIIKLINQAKEVGKIKKNIATEIVYHFIDMGISYFQNNIEYREKMLNNTQFKANYMNFLLANIFVEAGD